MTKKLTKKQEDEILDAVLWWNSLSNIGREKILRRLYKRRHKKECISE